MTTNPHTDHADANGTLTYALKGGDYVEIGGKVVEVFDTCPTSHRGTMIRFLVAGEVHCLRTFANDRLRRVETLSR